MKLPNHTALKEWASVISALGAGDQVVLLRKGGIADPTFGIEADRFYLFPTFLHQKERQFKPSFVRHFLGTDRADENPEHVPIELWCEVAAVFRVRELGLLHQVEPFVIFERDTIEERFRFRPDQLVHVIAVRAFRLPHPVEVINRSEYAGCRSWISVDESIDVDGSVPVLPDSELEQRVGELQRILSS
ncbi:MAG TPA: DUF1802 family protein [Thermoanaerobaculia bacterium]|nr:DUF1802 family protein [Thermoanaerobaculia bacterium]